VEIEEERRLLQVAMTRAKDRLDIVVPQRFCLGHQAGLGVAQGGEQGAQHGLIGSIGQLGLGQGLGLRRPGLPRWPGAPTSEAGAARHAGRANLPGVAALYPALDTGDSFQVHDPGPESGRLVGIAEPVAGVWSARSHRR
jgi:hypothetical protein